MNVVLPSIGIDWSPIWRYPVSGPRSGFHKLQGIPIYYDFDWKGFYGKDEPRRFPGQQSVADCVELFKQLHKRCDFVLLTTRDDEVADQKKHISPHSHGVILNARWLREIKGTRSAALKGHLLAASEETLKVLATIPSEQRMHAVSGLLQRMAEQDQGLDAAQFEQLFRSLLAVAEGNVSAGLVTLLLDMLPDQRVFLESLIEEYPDVARRWVQFDEEGVDVIGLAYRSKQLQEFHKLLHDRSFFEERQAQLRTTKIEPVWQDFFERNSWIFGYGLDYKFLQKVAPLLEQPTSGVVFDDVGKRTDGLMKTVAALKSLCYIEIKHHRTPLMNERRYRPGCFTPTGELTGGIAQLQATVFLRGGGGVVRVPDRESGRILDTVYNYQPKAFLVIGSLSEFEVNGSVDEYKFRSFELFRRGVGNPEILTFDELYERARHIVHTAEAEADRTVDRGLPENGEREDE